MQTPDVVGVVSDPFLTIVVGSHNAQETIVECISRLNEQRAGHAVEVIIVDNSTDATRQLLATHFESAEVVHAPPSTPMPQLWTLGLQQSTGEIVAITTAHCIPGSGWIQSILESHREHAAGIGGAIELDPSTGPVEWAIYFCRYSKFMLPFEKAVEHDLAADNASYNRRILGTYEALWADGFWEPTVHAAMRADGHALYVDPEIVVFHTKSLTTIDFARNRLSHGKQFGCDRAIALSRGSALFLLVKTPLVPFVLVGRAGNRIFNKGRHRMRFMASLPWLFFFYICWSLGESLGIVNALRMSSAGEHDPK